MAKIYVGTYGAYNNGSLKGAWLDLEDYDDKAAFYEACAELHEDEPDPEFMFQDWEDIPPFFISECGISGEFWDYMNYDDNNDGAAKAAYVDIRGEWDESNFEDAFCGKYDSELDYAYEIVEECGYLSEMPESMQCYFDYEKFARDLFMCDYTFADGFVFRDC